MTTTAKKTAAKRSDRDGYVVTEQPVEGGESSWRVERESDGVGIGAFHDDDAIDAAIAADRARA